MRGLFIISFVHFGYDGVVALLPTAPTSLTISTADVSGGVDAANVQVEIETVATSSAEANVNANAKCIHGRFADGFCLCKEPFVGEFCDIPVRHGSGAECPNDIQCGENGACVDKKCYCKHPFAGVDCRRQIAPVATLLNDQSDEDASNAVGTIISFAGIVSAKAMSMLRDDKNGALWIQILVVVLVFAALVLAVAVSDGLRRWWNSRKHFRTMIEESLPDPMASRISALLPAKLFPVDHKPGEFCVRVYLKSVHGHISGTPFGMGNIKSGEITVSMGPQYWSHKQGRHALGKLGSEFEIEQRFKDYEGHGVYECGMSNN